MKLLKIENREGLFLTCDNMYVQVDKIKKEDLLRLANLILSKEVELDEYSEDKIDNQAHQIVYKGIFERLRDLRDRRSEFLDESERLYLEEYEKYREQSPEPSGQPDTEVSPD